MLFSVAALGCENAEKLTSPPDTQEPTVIRPGQVAPSYSAPPGAPDEFDTPPRIGGLVFEVGITASEAWASAYMTYFASEADLTTYLTLRFEGSLAGSTQNAEYHRYALPNERTINSRADIPVPKACGHSASGRVEGHAWHEALTPLGYVSWGDVFRDDEDSASQLACEKDDDNTDGGGGTGTPPGGGGDEGDNQEPETCVVQYWYNESTGEIIYATVLYCY